MSEPYKFDATLMNYRSDYEVPSGRSARGLNANSHDTKAGSFEKLNAFVYCLIIV